MCTERTDKHLNTIHFVISNNNTNQCQEKINSFDVYDVYVCWVFWMDINEKRKSLALKINRSHDDNVLRASRFSYVSNNNFIQINEYRR